MRLPRSLLAFLGIAITALAWWLTGQYEPSQSPAADEPKPSGPITVWSAENPQGKFWESTPGKMFQIEGKSKNGIGKAITVTFEGEGWRGGGLNWKGWFPKEAGDDVSQLKSLSFYIRQISSVADADLSLRLIDNVVRDGDQIASQTVSVLGNGSLTRIDGEWRQVIIPLERFTHNKPLDLKRLWGIDFISEGKSKLVFQVDEIGFGHLKPPLPKFPVSKEYSAQARLDLTAPTYPIRDEIYGVCNLPIEKIKRYGLPIARWGGNRSSRFNWKLNADNAGHDWFFKNGGTPVNDPTQGGQARFIRDLQEVGSSGYVTVPMLGYVAKDFNSYGFSVKKYGPQQRREMGQEDVGNGLTMEGQPITGNDPLDTSIVATPEFIGEGVALVVKTAGRADAAKPGAKYWVLDNEPMLWHSTHRDVHPQPLGSQELWDRTVKYAEAIKKQDPSAKIAGFCSWGWMDLFYSAADEGMDRYRTIPDKDLRGGKPLAEWFIMKCGEYKKKHGKSLVDVFDFHWYPQAVVEGRNPYQGVGMSVPFNQLRMRSTRDLWDPEYDPESWTKNVAGGGPTRLIRRVRDWIDKHNPGMELAIGEYNFGGSDNITGALAQADVLGILARERADLAFIWSTPEGTQELAWQLFRDYDGQGGRFGDQWMKCSSDHPDLAIYAAKRSKDGAMTLVVVNKSLGSPCRLSLEAAGLQGKMRLWQFDQESEGKVRAVSQEPKGASGSMTLSLPAASGTMIVIE